MGLRWICCGCCRAIRAEIVGRQAGCQHVALQIVSLANRIFLSRVYHAKGRKWCLLSSIGCAAKILLFIEHADKEAILLVKRLELLKFFSRRCCSSR